MKTLRYYFLFTALLALFFAGCESLDVKNENDPDFVTATSRPSDVKGNAGSLINKWYMTTQSYYGPGLALQMGADAGTCSHGNGAMWDFSREPRIAWDNTPSYGNAYITTDYYEGLYSVLGKANDVLVKIVNEGMKIEGTDGSDETPMVQAVAYLGQALTLGYIGLFFDKGYVVTEATDFAVENPLVTYKELLAAAVAACDKCIAICASKTFTLPTSWLPGRTYTQKEVGEMANTFAARFLSYGPRNKAENDAVDWGKVLAYANKGLTYDLSPEQDPSLIWYGEYQDYANIAGWGRVDMRLVNMMDPAFPSRWVGANQYASLPAPTTSHKAGVDDRIFTDYQYLPSCTFRVERGYYHYSCYRYKAYENFHANTTGPLPLIKKAENDMLIAEALLKTSKLPEAAAIINAGTRVTRGKLNPVAATAAEIEAAIWHERFIELFSTSCGTPYCIMRKADKLQPGSPLHFPITGKQLLVNSMELYSFGPNLGVAGKDYSTGGWF